MAEVVTTHGCQAVAFAMLLSGTALAQSAKGDMGAQSRATVRIKVNIMPSFAVLAHDHASTERLSLRANVSVLRLGLVSVPARDSASEPRQPQLVLVVPD